MNKIVDLAMARKLREYYRGLSYEELMDKLLLEYDCGMPAKHSQYALSRFEHQLLIGELKAKAKTPFLSEFFRILGEESSHETKNE